MEDGTADGTADGMARARPGGGIVLLARGEAFEWRGPAPHVFLRVGDEAADLLRELAGDLSYGWGCIPVTGRLGGTAFSTSLMPKDGGYLVPLKKAVREAEGVGPGDLVEVELELPQP